MSPFISKNRHSLCAILGNFVVSARHKDSKRPLSARHEPSPLASRDRQEISLMKTKLLVEAEQEPLQAENGCVEPVPLIIAGQ
jgi:hypothetical protein